MQSAGMNLSTEKNLEDNDNSGTNIACKMNKDDRQMQDTEDQEAILDQNVERWDVDTNIPTHPRLETTRDRPRNTMPQHELRGFSSINNLVVGENMIQMVACKPRHILT